MTQVKHTAPSSAELDRLEEDLGLQAVGFYWRVMEYLTTHGGSMSLAEVDALARQKGADERWGRHIVTDFGLFPSADVLFLDKVVLPGAPATEPPTKKGAKKISFKEVQDKFNEICVSYSRVQAPSDTRRKKVQERLLEMSQLGDPMDVITEVFKKMEASDFMKGKNERKWNATFDWLIANGQNWAKTYEGHYDNKYGSSQKVDTKSVNSYWDK